MRHLFIVNPVAGGRDRTREIRAQAEAIFAEGGNYEVYTTTAPGDAVEKIRREASRNACLRVYAVGGDGTLNECVQGAAGLENTAVGLCPGGTGNDFARMFGSERRRLEDLHALTQGEVRPLDLIGCCGRYGINICSVGIDARIGTQVHDYPRVPLLGGAGPYLCSAVVNFCRGVEQPMELHFGSRSLSGNVALVCACNGRYYGGGWQPVPEARPDDGLLDFIIVHNISRMRLLSLAPAYAGGRYRSIPEKYLIHHRGTELHIESPESLSVNIDGELAVSHSVDFRVIPGGVNFIFPREMEFFKSSPSEYQDILSKSKISL